MKTLILSRQKPEQAPFREWLGDATIQESILFTSKERAASFSGFKSITAFDNYEESGMVEWAALEAAKTHNFERIIATSEMDILRAGRLRTLLGLPGQSGDSALAFRDKVEMKRLVSQPGKSFKVPRFMRIDEPIDLICFVQAHGFPVIVKPIDGCGSLGTRVLRREEDLKNLLGETLPRGLEVEQFIEGDQYHIDGLVLGQEIALMWPSKYVGNCLSFSQGGLTASTMLHPNHQLQKRLRDIAREVLQCLPTPTNTTFHLELFHTRSDEIYFCEIASRTGGGLINPSFEKAFGVNLNQIFVQSQAGLCPDLTSIKDLATRPRQLLGWGLVPPGLGVLRCDTTAKPTDPWVVSFNWTMQDGMRGHGARVSVDSVAHFLIEVAGDGTDLQRIQTMKNWTIKRAQWSIMAQSEKSHS